MFIRLPSAGKQFRKFAAPFDNHVNSPVSVLAAGERRQNKPTSRPYIKKEWCIRIVANPIRVERQ
ncbi:unnamed protein product, partial [marine sediment metagenome]